MMFRSALRDSSTGPWACHVRRWRAGRKREQELGHELPAYPGSGGGFIRCTGMIWLNVTRVPAGMAHVGDAQEKMWQ